MPRDDVEGANEVKGDENEKVDAYFNKSIQSKRL